MTYQCPLCHNELKLHDRSFSCENNHQFDLAKEGYVNLMPAHHKRSKDPGDNSEMIQARRKFLEESHYDPMRQAVAQLCSAHTNAKAAPQLLDIGCGEGYYTTQVANILQAQDSNAQVYGLDISKVAIRYAAKRYHNCDFSVASSHRLPFADNSLDAVLRIYAPCKADELNRVLKDDGVLITVTPASRHLYQLRELIYQEVRLHDEAPESITGFELLTEQHLPYMMTLEQGSAFELLQMTPFAWKATDELRQQLQTSVSFDCEADFMLRVYQKSLSV